MYLPCSGMLVQDPTKGGNHDVNSIFDQARQMGATQGPFEQHPSSSSRSFTGTGRLLTGETVPSVPPPPENILHNIYFWTNGFSVNDGPLRRFDDPENAAFLEVILIRTLNLWVPTGGSACGFSFLVILICNHIEFTKTIDHNKLARYLSWFLRIVKLNKFVILNSSIPVVISWDDQSKVIELSHILHWSWSFFVIPIFNSIEINWLDNLFNFLWVCLFTKIV